MEKEIIKEDIEKVRSLIKEVLGVDSYTYIERMRSLTNHTYKVVVEKQGEFVVRIPGIGTEELIVRRDEKISVKLANQLNIDADLLYLGDDGTKISKYIFNAKTMSVETLREESRVKKVSRILKKLHNSGVDTGIAFEVFELVKRYEKVINNKNVRMFHDYEEIKKIVMSIKAEADKLCNIRKVTCHNDPICENWVEDGNGKMYLIDWEYAGMNDFMWDLADLSIEAEYDDCIDELLLKEYFCREITWRDWKHFLANKIYLDFLWSLWGKARIPYDGQSMEEYAVERYERMKENIKVYSRIEEK